MFPVPQGRLCSGTMCPASRDLSQLQPAAGQGRCVPLLPVHLCSSGLQPPCFHLARQGACMLETWPGAVTMQGSHFQRPWELARSKVPEEENGEVSFSWPRSPCLWSTHWGSFLGILLFLLLICDLPLPLLGTPQTAAAPGLLSQSVLCLSLWPLGRQMPGSRWGYRIVRVLFPAVCS